MGSCLRIEVGCGPDGEVGAAWTNRISGLIPTCFPHKKLISWVAVGAMTHGEKKVKLPCTDTNPAHELGSTPTMKTTSLEQFQSVVANLPIMVNVAKRVAIDLGHCVCGDIGVRE